MTLAAAFVAVFLCGCASTQLNAYQLELRQKQSQSFAGGCSLNTRGC